VTRHKIFRQAGESLKQAARREVQSGNKLAIEWLKNKKPTHKKERHGPYGRGAWE
jgi:hypothetical protein